MVKAFRLGLMDLDPPWIVSETAEKPQRAQPIIELKIGCMLGALYLVDLNFHYLLSFNMSGDKWVETRVELH